MSVISELEETTEAIQDEVDDLELDDEDDHDPTDRDPSSYSVTVTSDQLASEGAEYKYETLREAAGDLVDGGYWGDGFEVHPSRVGETTLRQNHKIASRILAGMARSKASRLRGRRLIG